MASRYWVGGSGTWDASDTTHWAASSGGAGGQSVPGASDTVTLDAASGGGTVTVATDIGVVSVTGGAFTGTLDFGATNPTMQTFSFSGAGTRTLNMGSGNWTISGNAATVWNTGTATGLTFNSGTSTINFTYAGATGTRTIANGTSATVFNNINVTAGSDIILHTTNGPSINNLNYTGFTGSISATNSITILGDITLGAGMTIPDGAGGFSISGTNKNIKITCNGVAFNNLTISTIGSTVTLADDLIVKPTRVLAFSNGIFSTNNKNIFCGFFSSSNSNIRTINLGSSTVNLTGDGIVWTTQTSNNLSLIPGTSTINISNVSASTKTFTSGILTFNNLKFSGVGTGALIIGATTATNTFNNIILADAPKSVQVFAGKTIRTSKLSFSGTSGNLNTIASTTGGTPWNLVGTDGPINQRYISLQDSAASGTTFYAADSTDVSGNTGWIFGNPPSIIENAKRDENHVPALLAASNINDSNPLSVNSVNNALMVSDGNAITGGTAITQVSVKGGAMRVIDSATGDVPIVGTNGWVEDEKYGIYYLRSANGLSGEFDSAVTRTGRLTLKLSTTDATGRGQFIIGANTSAGSIAVPILSKYGIAAKPNTTYRLNCYAKTNNVPTNSCYLGFYEFNSAGTRLVTSNSNTLSGTKDWTLLTKTITTAATTNWLQVLMLLPTAGNISDAWFDVNSMTLEEVSTITNPTATPALLYPTFKAVSSTDNIDQSQVVATSAITLGNATTFKNAQQFLPTKKNHTGVIIQRSTETGTYTGDITITLEADNANAPSGTPLATVSYTNVQWEAITLATDFTVNLPATLTVDGSTKYWYVISSSTQDALNYTKLKGVTPSAYASGLNKYWNGSAWGSDINYDLYFKTLYQKNTDNFTVSTDTETLTYTAPTTDGWGNGTVIDTYALNLNPINLAPGVNNVYYSSNGAATADGTQDASMLATVDGTYYPVTYRNATRDENHVPTLLAVSADDGVTPVQVYCDWSTRELLVKST